jgi:FKBP-type peptidyl-prolyl cis-trans isomerase FklB
MKLKLTTLALIAITGFQSCSTKKELTESTELTDDQKSSYAVGMMLGKNMKQSGVDSIDVKFVSQAISDVLNGDSLLVSDTESKEILNVFFKNIQAKKSSGMQQEGIDFLTANKEKPGITTTASGLQYKILKPGVGAYPKATDKVEVHYEGKLLSGKVFDSSFERGKTTSFGLNQVIKGWTEGLQYINEGGEIELYIPYELAYGERGAGQNIPPFSALIFKVQLVAIVKEDAAPAHNPNDGQDHSGHNH